MDLGFGERVEEKNGWGVVEDDEPAVGRTDAKIGAGSFWELEMVYFACGEVVEGPVGLGLGTSREGKQEPGGLRGEVERGLWK